MASQISCAALFNGLMSLVRKCSVRADIPRMICARSKMAWTCTSISGTTSKTLLLPAGGAMLRSACIMCVSINEYVGGFLL